MLRKLAWIVSCLAAVAIGTLSIPLIGLSGLLAVDLLRDGEAWYFPGDPACAEVGVEVGLVGLVGASAFFIVAWRLGWTGRLWLRVPAVTAIGLAAAALMAPLACIAQRHFGEWSRLRAFVWQQVEIARAEGLDVLPFQPPLEIRFAGRPEPARIRSVTTGRWPGVLIDFGNGGNASFDLRTMWCDYSD